MDAVLESTRAKEQAVKKETSEQLELFRRQQEEADKGLLDEGGDAKDMAASPIEQSGETQWAVNARKRKRLKDEKGLKGAKLRKSSSISEAPQSEPMKSTPAKVREEDIKIKTTAPEGGSNQTQKSASSNQTESSTALASLENKPMVATKPSSLPGLGLADYSSDEE